MDQGKRNKLRNIVIQCRKLLENATARVLQGRFGIYPFSDKRQRSKDIVVEDDQRMAHLTDEDRACRQDLLDHLAHIQAIGYKPSEGLEQLTREIAFTHLNRLCAYKMMEARGLIREAVSRGLKSQGFFFYLADHPDDEKLHNNGQQEMAYQNFLDWLGGMLSEEIGVLFNPNDPANRIYPPQRVIDEVLALINDGELRDIWSQDETIGWVYQYFTPKELRDKARKESQAPRNSYELAFRNQFFTPRYVVEFLTDNTLGRIWYEMRKGETVLKDRCRYLVRRPTEIFLNEGEERPAESKDVREDLSQEELLKQPVHIPHRPKKDPREIRVLDPACGSGHFLLYCFDLLQVIYEEAYDDPDLGTALRRDYPALEDLRRDIPGMILRHNLHGIDIDLRATQIAALALWLCCQRAYQELRINNGERPKITRSNIVCAEPMSGQEDLLMEFTATLQPKVLGQLVEAVFEKMKLAGEAGSLLKIEEETKDAVAEARKQWLEGPKPEQQLLFPGMLGLRPEQQELRFDVKGITDKRFWEQAEDCILDALKGYAERAENGHATRCRLFAEDATRGFAFIDLCCKRYDVVLMNPPFGIAPKDAFEMLRRKSPNTFVELYASFVDRGISFAPYGLVGSITSRGFFAMTRLEKWRREAIVHRCHLLLDLGLDVMDDAFVRSCAYVVSGNSCDFPIIVMDAQKAPSRAQASIAARWLECGLSEDTVVYARTRDHFENLPHCKFVYKADPRIIRLFTTSDPFEGVGSEVRTGLTTFDDFRFLRMLWEVQPADMGRSRKWEFFSKGGEYAKYYTDVHLVINRENDGAELAEVNRLLNGQVAQSRQGSSYYYRPGITFTSRSGKGISVRALPSDCVISHNAPTVYPMASVGTRYLLGWINSRIVRLLIEMQASTDYYTPGSIKVLPWIAPEPLHVNAVEKYVEKLLEIYRSNSLYHECSWLFCFLQAASELHLKDIDNRNDVLCLRDEAVNLQIRVSETIDEVYGLESSTMAVDLLENDPDTDVPLSVPDSLEKVCRSLSYSVGVTFGRWDVRITLNRALAPKLPDPFDSLPVCPPGMLVAPDGLPAKRENVPSNYPVDIDWDGILVDDPEHDCDIVCRVRDALEVIWKDRAEAIEKEACEILGVNEMRDYFRKPGNRGFWMDHVKRYSKSRRKAPIYWYLRSAKGNYGLWLYYHRLDKDILFKALINYVEPKIRLEEDRLNTLRGRKEAAGSSGREAKQIEKEIDRQEQFISELRDFKDKLRCAADLHLDFDLNDGVILNMAPLWELIPWKEPQKYWEALQEGAYDWSHIAYRLWPERVEELCRKDRSIAMAHGREDVCEVGPPNTKRKRPVE